MCYKIDMPVGGIYTMNAYLRKYDKMSHSQLLLSIFLHFASFQFSSAHQTMVKMVVKKN